MAVYPRGGSFQASFMIKGERYRETFPTSEEAEKWEAKVREACRLGKPIPTAKPSRKGKVQTMGQLMEYTMKHHYAKLPASSTSAQRIANHILGFTGTEFPVDELDGRKIDEMVDHFQTEHGNTLATVNRKMAVLSKSMRFAKRLGAIKERPEIPFFKEHAHVVRYLTEDEEQRMVRTAVSWGDQELADLIVFGVDSGARVSEVLKSPWSWFHEGFDKWSIWITKANQPRMIPLTRRCQDILKRRKGLGEAGPFHRYDYTSIRRRFDRLCQTLKIEGVTIHTLRHTCASRLVQRGVDIRRVQIWMGHKALATTLRYAHLAPEHLNDALAVLETPVEKTEAPELQDF
ncbi:tyrosine-type recombinase/integrase [Amorphus coralli]|uniref:tyrosine-type recombinase/integrase n=1 Tax=Amorphus coralli TaxID=340680 RepID=UPI00037B6EAD|nr:site-specific integrase [Amorphus coralli]